MIIMWIICMQLVLTVCKGQGIPKIKGSPLIMTVNNRPEFQESPVHKCLTLQKLDTMWEIVDMCKSLPSSHKNPPCKIVHKHPKKKTPQ
jgi:hypothetical protein